MAVSQQYWSAVFVVFVLSYFLPVGSGVPKTIFYLLIFLPALFSLRQADLSRLLNCTSFWLLLTLCAYAAVRSVDVQSLRDTTKATAIIFVLLIAASKLPKLQPEKVRQLSLVFILILIAYVFLNAVHQHLTRGWNFGQRLSPLFGQSKSVIFTADLLVSILATYSWSCIKTRDVRHLFLVHTSVIGVAMVFLQTRSVLPTWAISTAILIAAQAQGYRHVVKVSTVAILGTGLLVWLILYWTGMTDSLTARGDSYRIETWVAYFSSTAKCGVLMGCGWGSELSFVANDGTAISHPHSMYMQHFYWGGVIGLLLLAACIIEPLTKGIRFSNYASWPLLAGSIALVLDGKGLLSLPNERWLLVLIPLVVLIGELSRLSHANRSQDRKSGDEIGQ